MDKFMVIDRVENYIYGDKVVGRTIYDKGGNKQNIKKGQGGALEKRWDELDAGAGRAIKLEMSEYQGHPFVANFEWVESKFVEQAQRQVEDKSLDTKNRSVCLSYAKDLVIAGKVNLGQIFEWSDKLHNYILGGEDVSDKVSTEKIRPDTREGLGQGDSEAGEFDEGRMKTALNRVKFTKKGIAAWLNQMFGIAKTQDPMDMIRLLNDKQLEVLWGEIKSREKEKTE